MNQSPLREPSFILLVIYMVGFLIAFPISVLVRADFTKGSAMASAYASLTQAIVDAGLWPVRLAEWLFG